MSDGTRRGIGSNTWRLAIAAGSVLTMAWAAFGASPGVAKGGPPVRLRIDSPKPGQTLPGPDVEVKFTLENYEVYFDSTAKKGQHIHMILDDTPYVPRFSRDPYVIKNVAPGTHTLRCFPSRPWHESIKDPTAFAMVTFNVGKADGRNTPAKGKPLLTYSRPKGEYVGHAADSILVDFWVKNCHLGPKAYKVKLTIDGQSKLLTEWKPLWKVGLAAGDHRFATELLDPKGNPAPGPFNSTERTITLKPDTAGAVSHH